LKIASFLGQSRPKLWRYIEEYQPYCSLEYIIYFTTTLWFVYADLFQTVTDNYWIMIFTVANNFKLINDPSWQLGSLLGGFSLANVWD
jgi:hypothetical protein